MTCLPQQCSVKRESFQDRLTTFGPGLFGLWLSGLILAGCAPFGEKLSAPDLPQPAAPVTVVESPLVKSGERCSGVFVPHALDHVTTTPGGETVREFEANGGGVAINDLDNDGDLDLVLANHDQPNSIFWNKGHLNFQVKRLPDGDSRGVNIVDVDGDGWLDVVFTRRVSVLDYWRNLGQEDGDAPSGESGGHFTRQFKREALPGGPRYAYAMNWGDLDGDGDLDLVTGSYNASLLLDLGQSFLIGGGGGVFYNEQQGGRFSSTLLATEAQALTLELFDLNADGRLDILVGNDFALPDQAWLRSGDEWVKAAPFAATSHSTMSFDWGDLNNDGRWELFSTDMKPYDRRPQTLAAWQPLLAEMMDEAHPPGDPQIMANVLQVPTDRGSFRNEAARWGIEASGWSWSSKFGDLNNDGFLDLYVVNGMIEQKMFSHLPEHELVEQNQAFRNTGQGRFAPALEWGLSSTLSGRGMSMADLDEDGDLDIVINNLRGPAYLFENQLCQGASLPVDLFWPDSRNTRALGARLILRTARGNYYRYVRAASGYLSGDPARVHFGFPVDAGLQALEVYWPDGLVSIIEGLSPDTRLTVTR